MPTSYIICNYLIKLELSLDGAINHLSLNGMYKQP